MKNKICFTELSGRERAFRILDEGSQRELLGPLYHLKSPHLLNQGIVAQNDDGMIVVRGTLSGRPAVVISMEGKFQGGGIGEIAGAKFAAALENALEENKKGNPLIPIVLFDTGGVRLQEANYGLLAIAEIQSLLVELRKYQPVIGVIPGRVGCFGGMSMTAGLFSFLLITREGRLTLNGPEVIEQEAGKEEWDASDKRKIWKTCGGANRTEQGLADILVKDDLEEIRRTAAECAGRSIPEHRSSQVAEFQKRIGEIRTEPAGRTKNDEKGHAAGGRGTAWFQALSAGESLSQIPSVLCQDILLDEEVCRLLAVVPDPDSRFPRASKGEVGLEQGWELARLIREVMEEDRDKETKRPLIALVDVPSQAYGYKEELNGLFLSCAASVDAYASARAAGHPVITVIVGNAISGAFLAHGLQGSYMIALDDEKVTVHAMSKKSAARITKRSVDDMDAAANAVPAIAYDIRSFYCLGAVNRLITLENHEQPTEKDLYQMREEIRQGIAFSRAHGNTLSYRLETENAGTWRALSIQIRRMMKEEWDG